MIKIRANWKKNPKPRRKQNKYWWSRVSEDHLCNSANGADIFSHLNNSCDFLFVACDHVEELKTNIVSLRPCWKPGGCAWSHWNQIPAPGTRSQIFVCAEAHMGLTVTHHSISLLLRSLTRVRVWFSWSLAWVWTLNYLVYLLSLIAVAYHWEDRHVVLMGLQL